MINRLIVIVLFLMVFVVLIPGVYMNTTMRNYRKTEKNIRVRNVDLAGISDGVYKGSCKAVLVSAKVEVMVEDHEIVEIRILEHMGGRGEKAEMVSRWVIDRQSLKVNAVSGATTSSKVILKAIENALRRKG